MNNTEQLLVDMPFMALKEVLPDITNVETVTAGASPATIRYLTSTNLVINVGIEHVNDKQCEVKLNNNSFVVKDEQLVEAHKAILKHVATLPVSK